MSLTCLPNHSLKQKNTIQRIADKIDALALSALLDEVRLEQKPGLVCPSSMGSHDDMDFTLFQSSIEALQGYFARIFHLGHQQQTFSSIQQAGIQAELKMLQATQGINTHKGAIFNLGFACAGLGRCLSQGLPLDTIHICQQISQHWKTDLLHNLNRNPNSHGQQMRRKYAVSGAIEQVAHGFELVRTHALPCFKHAISHTQNMQQAAMQTLLMLIARLEDTNILWRGGMSSLLIAQDMATEFLQQGGVFQSDWQKKLHVINQYFIQHRLSPGGSADLLGVTIFFYKVEHEFSHLI